MWAKQIIIDSKKVMGAAILAVGEAKDLKGKIHRSERNQPNKWLHFSSVMPEKPLTKDGSYRIPDLICLLTDGTQLAIEIFVNNAVSEEKASFFNSLKLDCLEIDLSCLTDKDFNSHSEFEEQVLYEAPRQWIFSSFYASQVKKAQKEAQEKAAAANERIRSDREENRNFKATWRQANSEFISLIEAYMVPSNRLKVSSLYESQLLQMGTLSNSYKAWFDQHLSGNPEIINIPVRGELGFNCHRSAWQWEVYMRAVLQSFQKATSAVESSHMTIMPSSRALNPDKLLTWYDNVPKLTPENLYNSIKTIIPLNRICTESERINHGALTNEREKPQSLAGLKVKEWRELPKPVCIIRRYFQELVDRLILEKFGNDTYVVKMTMQPWLYPNKPTGFVDIQ